MTAKRNDSLSDWAKSEGVTVHGDPDQSAQLPEARFLFDLKSPPKDDPNELLKRRFLCRGSGLLFVGPTGIGKSSSAMQAMILWACGRDYFGIKSSGPLKSLLIQAENDDGDLVEMRDGVIAGLNLTEGEKALASKNVIVAREDRRTDSKFFAEVVRPLLKTYNPDLVWIDPALAYLGGDSSGQCDVGVFLRNQLNPLIRQYNCGAVLLHHTNKPTKGKDGRSSNASDYAYLGNGSVEWANWPRAILALRSLGADGRFELRAAKRGRRLDWKESDGQTPALCRIVQHTKKAGVICWELAASSEPPNHSNRRREPTEEDIMKHVPKDGPIPKATLRQKANLDGVAINKFNRVVEILVTQTKLYEWQRKRSGTNAEKLLSRSPQPVETDLHGDSHAQLSIRASHASHSRDTHTAPPL